MDPAAEEVVQVVAGGEEAEAEDISFLVNFLQIQLCSYHPVHQFHRQAAPPYCNFRISTRVLVTDSIDSAVPAMLVASTIGKPDSTVNLQDKACKADSKACADLSSALVVEAAAGKRT